MHNQVESHWEEDALLVYINFGRYISYAYELAFNPDYAIGFVVRGVIERKSGYLEIEA